MASTHPFAFWKENAMQNQGIQTVMQFQLLRETHLIRLSSRIFRKIMPTVSHKMPLIVACEKFADILAVAIAASSRTANKPESCSHFNKTAL